MAPMLPGLAAGGRVWSPHDAPLRVGGHPSDHIRPPGLTGGSRAVLHATPDGWVIEPVSPSTVFHGRAAIGPLRLTGPVVLHLDHPDGPALHLAVVAAAVGARPVPTPGPGSGPGLGPGPGPDGPATITLGRAQDNDVVIADLLVSRHHAVLERHPHGWVLTDRDTVNGTFVDGKRCSGPTAVAVGQRLTLGTTSYALTPTGPGLIARSPGPGLRGDPGLPAPGFALPPMSPGAPTRPAPAPGPAHPAYPAHPTPRPSGAVLAARNLTVEVGEGTRILDDVTFELQPGQLLAIVGPSGSGKSTLLNALTGSRRPEGGTVEVRGLDLYTAYEELSRSIGYVPQDDILHHQLTVRQELDFSAELRFPEDVTPEERNHRVHQVIGELGLDHRADVAIDKISGGQRKRVSVALELLTGPDLLYLDEPTSGLDPGLERTVMELLRGLASAGRGVVVVTHSLQSLDLCDLVLFMAPGGRVSFFGSPRDALSHFGRADFIEVFRDLERAVAAPTPAVATPRAPTGRSVPTRAGPRRAAHSLQPWRRQVAILCRRHWAILMADRQNLGFLAGSVAIPGLLILLLMGSGTLDLGQIDPVEPLTLLGAVVVAAVAIGTANSIREVVKEVPIYLRERSVGLQRSAYLSSKLFVIGAVTAVQLVVLVLVASARSGGPDHANLLLIPRLELIFDVVLTGIAAVALGLLLSTLVSSSEKAMALVPVVFVVQWLLSGAGLDLQAKPVLRDVARLTAANWGMAASASTVDENQLSQTCSFPLRYTDPGDGPTTDRYGYPDPDLVELRAEERANHEKEQARRDAAPTCDARWKTGLGSWLPSVLALLLMTGIAVFAADRLLARKEPLDAQRALDWPSPRDPGPTRPF